MAGITLDKTCMHCFKVTDAMTGEITCSNCGVVLSEKAIDFGPENASQTADESQNHHFFTKVFLENLSS